MSLVLGVDVGSQSIKVVVVDEGGDVVASGSAALSMTHRHDGWAEQDPHTYRTALRDAVRAATAGIEPTRVVAMGLGSQVDGVVVCDGDRSSRSARRSSGWTNGPPSSAIGWSARSARICSPSGRGWWPMPRTAHRR